MNCWKSIIPAAKILMYGLCRIRICRNKIHQVVPQLERKPQAFRKVFGCLSFDFVTFSLISTCKAGNPEYGTGFPDNILQILFFGNLGIETVVELLNLTVTQDFQISKQFPVSRLINQTGTADCGKNHKIPSIDCHFAPKLFLDG